MACKTHSNNQGMFTASAKKIQDIQEGKIYIHIYIYTIAASPLASSGFAAIGCFRASPYGDIHIFKVYG